MGAIGFFASLLLMGAIVTITPPQNYGDPRNWQEMSEFGSFAFKAIFGTMFLSAAAGALVGRRWERRMRDDAPDADGR